MKPRNLKCYILILMAVLFLGSMARLFVLRFESGDIYAPYSSLRSDPLGTKALYRALELTNALSVARNYLPVEKLAPQKGTTLFFAGLNPHDLTIETSVLDSLEEIVSDGGRLVLAFYPLEGHGTDEPAADNDIPENQEDQEAEEICDPEAEQPAAKPESVSLEEAWGFSLANTPQPEEKETNALSTGCAPIEGSIFWPAPAGFEDLARQWQPLLTKNGVPVIIERKKGEGSIVLCADSYMISNEAMKYNRAPLLLTWLTGNNTSIIFDEFHLGIIKSPGMASLIKKYRLHGLLMVIAILTLLFGWKQSTPQALKETPDNSGPSNGLSAEKDDSAGLSSLLKRYIPEKELLNACLKEWEKTGTAKQEIKDRIHVLTASGTPDTVHAYRDICRMLLEEKHT